jgi:hypothetical protein
MAWSGVCSASIEAYHFTFQENTVKKLRLLPSSIALTILLSVSASAGIMTTGNSQPPPPPPPAPTSVAAESTEAEADGTMDAEVASPAPVTEIALSVLQSVLALF